MTKQSGYIPDNIIQNFNKFDNSFFRKFFDSLDPDVLTWSLTVLEKLYSRGVLPFYVDRKKGNGNILEDEDLLSLLSAKTHLFAILVIYVRLFENIESNDTLKRQFLKDLGLYVALDQTSADLDYIFDNYMSEFEKRGTDLVHLSKADGNDVDGEILRLLNYATTDEFVFALLSNSQVGWSLGNSSPTYRGADKITNLIKAYEYTQEVQDLSLYPLQNSSYISLDVGYIRITDPGASFTGIRYDGDASKRIVIDPRVNYEMSFRITLDYPLAFTFDCEIGVDCFSSTGSTVGLLNNQNGIPSNNFYLGDQSIIKVSEVEYWFRGVIFNLNQSNQAGETLNLGYGNNLRFVSNANYITPKILFSNFQDPSNEIIIRDFKFRPLDLPFSLGMLGVKNFIINFIENNSGRFSSDIQDIISTELLPYSSNYQPIFINEL